MSIPCTKLPIVPTNDEDGINSIAVYSKNNNQKYIVATFDDDGIYEYDIQNRIWSPVFKWQQQKILVDTDWGGHGCAMNNINGKLHLFGGFDPFYAILNMKTKQFDVKCCYIDSDSSDDRTDDTHQSLLNPMNIPELRYAKGVCVGSDLHIIAFDFDYGSMKHLIIDTKKFCITDVKQSEPLFWNQRRSHFEVIYAKASEQFIFIGGRKCSTKSSHSITTNSRDIFYCNTNDLKWTRSDMKLPLLQLSRYSDACFSFIAYDYIIFVIYPTIKEIWCLDLLDATWYKCEKKFVIEHSPVLSSYRWSNYVRCIKVDENTVHFICHHEIDSDSDTDSNDVTIASQSFHLSVRLLDMISTKLRNKYTTRYHMLMHGYLSGCGFFVPLDVVQLLTHFYSALC